MNKETEYNVIDEKAPIAFEKLAEILMLKKDKEVFDRTVVSIDYKDSEYKGKKLLLYLANIGVKSDIHFESQEDALEVLKSYMTLDRVSSILSLDILAAYCLSVYAEVDVDYFFGQNYLDKEVAEKWVKDNEEIVKKWFNFFMSLPVFMIESTTHLKKIVDPKQTYKEIDKLDYISLNVVNLIKTKGFVDFILSSRKESELYYFKEQFQESIFNGKNLYYHLIKAESEVFASCIGIFSNILPADTLLMVKESADTMEQVAGDSC